MKKSLINDFRINDYVFNMNLSKAPLVMVEMYEKAMNDDNPNYNSPFNQLQFLKLLVSISSPKKILELGTYRGLSTLAIGIGLLCRNAKIISCDITDKYVTNYIKYWKKASINQLIDLRIGRANDTLDLLISDNEAGSFDFSYIDANKSEYLDYYEKTMELTKSGGIIVIDNVLWKGSVAYEEIRNNFTNSMRNLNERIKNDERVDSVLVPFEDGIQLIRKI